VLFNMTSEPFTTGRFNKLERFFTEYTVYQRKIRHDLFMIIYFKCLLVHQKYLKLLSRNVPPENKLYTILADCLSIIIINEPNNH